MYRVINFYFIKNKELQLPSVHVIKLHYVPRGIYTLHWKIRSNVCTCTHTRVFIFSYIPGTRPPNFLYLPGTAFTPNHSTLYYLFLFFFFFRVFFALRSFAPVNCSDAFLMATLDNSSSSPISSKLSPSASSIVSKPSSTGKDIL